uniref:UDP-2,4-diacetamido-2,4,6-trideoxy-beta-L-altropyranose hydrolase n=1 Tax=Candidatus Kentrum sp. FM TaxID=2126340 RepID=A0A450SHQ5_9GAMM|nr:MAG: UDP-2,4-diacetamido-2,4,6-trideoxy-beta-L-altropyranose hydrolase [Candidatus Kentron sp. FM]VFJ57296.1 MAG: UDP-2,4-diacetamido-2,4,6-trideoxy-beta-L-altropyranose hydrolase [Candidatus Kentron sp. FM]VFK08928.1 MAG: UDP-2,4-diacetamido-2,4,6-trideoxy-beta-L-altropyranose hydrolase [Candidatus Kentron sp. FM]
MKVVFRVDASNRIGTGHVIRCLTLAEALRDRGARPHFICRAHPGHLLERLQRQAMPVTVLPPAPDTEPGHPADYAAWLGVTQGQDAQETIAALGDERPDWLIVDHYGLDAQWEQRLRSHVGRLMVIDDLANRLHDCDLLLDQNVIDEPASDGTCYRNLTPTGCRLLLGPRHALLRPEYADWRGTSKRRDGRVRRVLVFLGGSDPGNVTGLALGTLSAPEFRHLAVDVVVGANNPHRSAIENQATRRARTTLHGPRPHLADLMAQADLAIGAGGTTTWERLCLGLPSLVISIADNQEPACLVLARAGLIRYLGDAATVGEERMRAALGGIMDDPEEIAEQSLAGRLLVDGLGALRVLETLDPTPVEQLHLRPVNEDDITLYYDWANEPEVRRQSIDSNPIPWVQHQDWFHDKLTDARSHLFVLQAGNLPVGQVRFDCGGDEARIGYSLDALVRGRGWAANMITMGARRLRESQPVALRAEVKPNNNVSRAVFLRLGFTENVSGGIHVFRLPSSRIAAVG